MEKVSLFDYYIGIPLKRALGYWYCDHCKKYHHPRVKQYGKLVFRQYFCSLGKEVRENHK